VSPVVAELDVTIPAAEIAEAAARMFAQISKEARVRGFRRGKVPLGVVKRMFHKSVYAELTGDLTYRAFLSALKEHDLSPIGEPEFTKMEGILTEGADYGFSARVEIAPQLETVVTDGIELKRSKLSVKPEVVDSEIHRLQVSMATTKDLEKPRPVKKGDMVVVEMTRRLPDGTFSDTPMPDQEFALDEDNCPPVLLDQLPGKNVGDTLEVTFGADEKHPSTFRCVLKGVKERILPAADDELARDLGDFDTMADLRADIEKRYLASLEHRQREGLRRELFDALRQKNPMALPPAIVAKQAESMRGHYDSIMKQIGAPDKEPAEGDSGDGNADELSRQAAVEIVHTHFLVEEVARHGELKVTDADLDAHFEKMAQTTGLPLERIRAEYSKPQYVRELEGRLLEDKVFDFVVAKVKIVDVDAPSPA